MSLTNYDYKMFYEDLAAKGLILIENIPHDEFSVINKEDSIKLFTHPKKLVYDSKDDVLSYIDDDGKIIACPEISSGVSKAASWLSERLMIPPFDFEQDGDLIIVEEIEIYVYSFDIEGRIRRGL